MWTATTRAQHMRDGLRFASDVFAPLAAFRRASSHFTHGLRRSVSVALMADRNTDALRRGLRNAGFSNAAINAAWPGWWNEEAAAVPSARAELRFALARNLGISPKALIGERVEFVWRDQARFKNLSGQDAAEQAALNSFGTSIGRSLLQASSNGLSLVSAAALDIRKTILASRPVVDLLGLLATCWTVGIPVVCLRVFPLRTKAMHAMVIELAGR